MSTVMSDVTNGYAVVLFPVQVNSPALRKLKKSHAICLPEHDIVERFQQDFVKLFVASSSLIWTF